ncbi:MAG: DUF5010 domain-containing protein [Chloroflexi bacterium]|nr:DUF5010 domain-containing protein [Chloroflexota bacterium]
MRNPGITGRRRARWAIALAAGFALLIIGCESAPVATTVGATPTPQTIAVTAPTAQPPDVEQSAPVAIAATAPPEPVSTATRAAPTPTPAATQTPPPAATSTRLASAPVTLFTPQPTPATGPSATPLPTFAVPPGFPTETPSPDYLSWARPGAYRSPYFAPFALEGFNSRQPLATTYFFYWFDYTGRTGGTPPRTDFLPFKPTDIATTSFFEPGWYEKQFSDMLDAGIDFVLPDYWGEPRQYGRRVAPAPVLNYFATQGLPPMIEALDRLRARGKNLKLGMFLDTTIMNNEDLTTARGKQILYASIRDYYSRIPPVHWAAIDNQPIVWLYDAQKVYAFNQSTFDYIYEQFAKDFGGLRPYIVRELQWYQAKNTTTQEIIKTEGMYGWGAAPSGFNSDPRFTVAEVGPGFSNTQFGGQGRLFTDRAGGQYYEENLILALRSRRKILAVETWNELGEASGILETLEFGRQYIELTRKYVDMLKAGRIP